MAAYIKFDGLMALNARQKRAIKDLPRHAIHGSSPMKQIDHIRSWLEYGSGNAVFPKKIEGVKPSSNANCVVSVADELRIYVNSNSFRNAVKKYKWSQPATTNYNGNIKSSLSFG